MNQLNKIRLFVFDLDGTVYIENKLIEGALDLFNFFLQKNISYSFITNNSSTSSFHYIEKIKSLGIDCSEKNIFTSGMSLGLYLKEMEETPKIYLVGTKSFEEELKQYIKNVFTSHNDDINTVVVGFDKELTYKKIEEACYYISSGANFFATNIDLVCPIKDGKFIPDCGSICQLITNSTGIHPTYFGKPEKNMIDYISRLFDLDVSEIAIVGDRLYTDIALGKNSGCTSICLLTGETSVEMIESSSIKPDYIFSSIKELFYELKNI